MGERTHFIAMCAASLFVRWAGAAQYTEIQDNAFDGWNEVAYVGGVFSFDLRDERSANSSQVLTLLEDTGPVPGFTGNVRLRLNSSFLHFGQSPRTPPIACLAGGSFSLTFDYWDGVSMIGHNPLITSHELSGPIPNVGIEITSASQYLSTLTGIFAFDDDAGVKNLPGSNNWGSPDLSTGVALTFAAGGDLSAYMTGAGWSQDMPQFPQVTFDSQFSFFPESRPLSGGPPPYYFTCPEPAVLAMFAIGSSLLIRRPRRPASGRVECDLHRPRPLELAG